MRVESERKVENSEKQNDSRKQIHGPRVSVCECVAKREGE